MILRKLDRLFVRFRDKDDGAALAAVFDATSRELFEVACHLVKNASDAEDLVQATFLTAIVKARSYDAASPLQGWLYGILWREAAKIRRSAARKFDTGDVAVRTEPSPAEAAQREEIPASVADALARLPERYREVVEPILRSDETAESLAHRLGRSPGTVRSQVHRGMERLRRTLPPGLSSIPSIAFAVRGLPDLRGSVLRSAGFPSTAAASRGAVPLAVEATLLSKTVLISLGSVAVLVTGGWFVVGRLHARGNENEPALVVPIDRLESPDSADSVSASSKRLVNASGHSERMAEVAVAASANASLEYWIARFDEAPDDWRLGLSVAYEVAKLAPDDALRIMTGVWSHLSVPVKEQVMKPFVPGHVHALKILDLAARDPAFSVQGRAFEYLASYAFRDFSTDYESYLPWAKQYRDLPVREVVTSNARRMISELLGLPRQELGKRVQSLHAIHVEGFGRKDPDLPAVLRDAGGLRVIEICLEDDDPKTKEVASEWSRWMEADERWLQTWMLPRIDGAQQRDQATQLATQLAAILAVSRPGCTWACKPLLEYIGRAEERAEESEQGIVYEAASGLAEIGDLSVVPELIGILLRDRTGKFEYAIGYYGLAKLTGVHWQKGYDGAWWLDWWEKNKLRFPAAVRDAVIPR